MAGVGSPRHSPPRDLCTSTSLATTMEIPSLHLTRSWWTPPSLPAATHLQAPMPTSTMPTTLPCVASPAHPATPALSVRWKATGPPCRPPYVCRRLPGNSQPKGKFPSREGAKGGGVECWKVHANTRVLLPIQSHSQTLPSLQPGLSLLVLHLCHSPQCHRDAPAAHCKARAL